MTSLISTLHLSGRFTPLDFLQLRTSFLRSPVEDILLVDLSSGIITNETTGESQEFEPFKDFMLEILEDGGLVNHHLKNKDKI